MLLLVRMEHGESHLDMIIDAYKALSRKLIREEHIEDIAAAKAWLIRITPSFATDRVFNDLFPACFGIELCKYKIEQQNQGRV